MENSSSCIGGQVGELLLEEMLVVVIPEISNTSRAGELLAIARFDLRQPGRDHFGLLAEAGLIEALSPSLRAAIRPLRADQPSAASLKALP
jgi:hypothetical protein